MSLRYLGAGDVPSQLAFDASESAGDGDGDVVIVDNSGPTTPHGLTCPANRWVLPSFRLHSAQHKHRYLQ
jgi:hypothetical protein